MNNNTDSRRVINQLIKKLLADQIDPNLSIKEINYLIAYLENIKKRKTVNRYHSEKNQKYNHMPNTFQEKRDTSYNNPYECGAKQNILEAPLLSPYQGAYHNDPTVLSNMGLSPVQNRYDHIRNIDIESSLFQREMTHLPGQRKISERDYDRFNLLPYDPQNTDHIVWTDDMPRGGYATRNDRIELG